MPKPVLHPLQLQQYWSRRAAEREIYKKKRSRGKPSQAARQNKKARRAASSTVAPEPVLEEEDDLRKVSPRALLPHCFMFFWGWLKRCLPWQYSGPCTI